ncbi:MAG TPA: hypothetical protein PKH16_00115 [Aequorivita sp.]|nr:hypothetical protein [Aequorivita sp.]
MSIFNQNKIMVYLITYDLNKGGQDYQTLYNLLEKYEYIRDPGLDSVWFISTSQSANQLSNNIQSVLDKNDRHVVTRMNAGEHQGWLNEDVWKWITDRL